MVQKQSAGRGLSQLDDPNDPAVIPQGFESSALAFECAIPVALLTSAWKVALELPSARNNGVSPSGYKTAIPSLTQQFVNPPVAPLKRSHDSLGSLTQALMDSSVNSTRADEAEGNAGDCVSPS